ncbi:hypothetical protein OPQ81_008145 [Rhizoctonia solani]|nr:hypothetical protein OPQ81_008145 [Rhizoctonia solani]
MPCIEGPGASVGTRDRDALLFLEMVGSMAGRSHPPVPLAGSDAWVPQGEVGTMVVHKNAFWERFLVKEFTFFIRDAIRLTNTIGNWVQSKDLKGDLLQETAWILTEPQNCPNDDSWSTTSDHSANFNWKGYKKVKISEHNCWTGSFNETKELNSDISVVAEIVPGTHFITVKTHIKYQYYDHHDDYPVGEHDPHPWTESTNAEIEWETKLAFNSVAGGTLGTEVTVGTPKCQCKVDDTTHGIFEMIFGGTRPDRVMTDKVQKYLEDNVKGDQIAALVDQGLTTHSHFVFSGAGAFTMKTPRFTSDHDLQVYLEPKMGRENQRE